MFRDETSKQLIAETRAPIPAKPGQPVRHDYEYERNCVANLFMIFAPLEGWWRVEVTDRHAAVDYAKVLKDLSDVIETTPPSKMHHAPAQDRDDHNAAPGSTTVDAIGGGTMTKSRRDQAARDECRHMKSCKSRS